MLRPQPGGITLAHVDVNRFHPKTQLSWLARATRSAILRSADYEASLMYGASYSEIQRNTAEFHTACHTALSRMPRQRRVAWMCPSRSTCCHGCWVSPNTFSDPVFAHRDAIRMCLSAPFGAIQQEHHTAYHTAVLLHTCDTHRHAFPPAPYSHTAPYSAV